MRRSFTAVLLSLLVMLPSTGCERAEPLEPDRLQPTLSSIQSNIFNQHCAVSGCHRGDSAPLGLDLSEGQARDHLVGVASREVPDLLRVEPGNPEDSYLVVKIEGGERIATGTQRMPRGRPPLSAQEISVVRQWIADGAPAN